LRIEAGQQPEKGGEERKGGVDRRGGCVSPLGLKASRAGNRLN